MLGGAGNDTLTLSPGNDTLDAGDGDDSIQGGTGNDSVDGGSGNDVIFGGDRILFPSGFEYGVTDDDTITGGGGNDTLALDETNGPLPAASIFGGAGNDTLTGGSAADFVAGESGTDTAFLGAGDDTFLWNPGDGSDVVEGQGGRDTLVFNGSDAAEKFDISDSGAGSPFHRARFTRDVGGISSQAFTHRLEPDGEIRLSRSDTWGCPHCDASHLRHLLRSGFIRFLTFTGRDERGAGVKVSIRVRLDSSVGAR